MPKQTEKLFSLRLGGGLLIAALGLFSSQLRCAGADNYFTDDADPSVVGDGGVKGDMAEGPCFMGTPQTEAQILNRCSDAERVERGTHIPPTTWDGSYPLPYEK